MVRLLLLLTLLLAFPLAHGKYRAYELMIINEEAGTERKVISTMDHIQYRGYYYLNPSEVITYVDSWMCWGNTGHFKPICKKPDANQESPPLPNPGGA